ncbi:MAG: hypothetical protein QXJ51_05445 [Sulfolobales archaeon]|jgi:hypothetical protein
MLESEREGYRLPDDEIIRVRRYNRCVAVGSLELFERDPEIFKRIHRISRLAGKKLYIILLGDATPSRWARVFRDHLATNIDVAIRIYEVREISSLEKLLKDLCDRNTLLFLEKREELIEYANREKLSEKCNIILFEKK